MVQRIVQRTRLMTRKPENMLYDTPQGPLGLFPRMYMCMYTYTYTCRCMCMFLCMCTYVQVCRECILCKSLFCILCWYHLPVCLSDCPPAWLFVGRSVCLSVRLAGWLPLKAMIRVPGTSKDLDLHAQIASRFPIEHPQPN